MTTSLTKVLNSGLLFRTQSGEFHLSRTSDSDVECKLLNGHVSEFGYLSAIREVADIETSDGFKATKAEYIVIAETVELLADVAGSEFAESYRVVAQLVREHANTL